MLKCAERERVSQTDIARRESTTGVSDGAKSCTLISTNKGVQISDQAGHHVRTMYMYVHTVPASDVQDTTVIYMYPYMC